MSDPDNVQPINCQSCGETVATITLNKFASDTIEYTFKGRLDASFEPGFRFLCECGATTPFPATRTMAEKMTN